MQIKLKSGKAFDMTQEQVRQLVNMYKDWVQTQFDADKLQHYFKDMHMKSNTNLVMISEQSIDSEKQLKSAMAKVLRCGNSQEVSDFIVQTIQNVVSKMILQSMVK